MTTEKTERIKIYKCTSCSWKGMLRDAYKMKYCPSRNCEGFPIEPTYITVDENGYEVKPEPPKDGIKYRGHLIYKGGLGWEYNRSGNSSAGSCKMFTDCIDSINEQLATA